MAKWTFSDAGETFQLSDGRTLGYVESGDPAGRPVFFFHGAPGSRLEGLTFDEDNKRLGIRMIAPERPGYGLSDVHKRRTYLDWARDVGELADHVGVDRFAVLGVSSGGPYAAAVSHELPGRVTSAGLVSGEGPYASDDYPEAVMKGDAFNASMLNKVLIWGARVPWAMRGLWATMGVFLLRNPVAFIESVAEENAPEHDREYFAREDVATDLTEAFRQGGTGAAVDHSIERLKWPFELEDIEVPVRVFHGELDVTVDRGVATYVCGRLPTCTEPIMFPGEGHSVLHYRYEEIVSAVLEAGE
ncbi:MAG: alpha/beta hydrolase [Acidimicrobiia bacterium]|nr:alpha/beta hydrolase [Acidimicrobiia bacterium]